MIIHDKNDRLLLDAKTQSLVREFVPKEDALEGMAEFFSTLADSTRIKIVSALSITPMCVNDISYTLGINQTTVSHQLKNLKTAGIVKCVRQGKIAFYSLKDHNILEVMTNAVNFL